MSIAIRPIELGNIVSVAEMIKESFDSDLHPYMVFAQHGVGEFLSIPLRYPGTAPDVHRSVAFKTDDPDIVCGYVDFRTGSNGEHFLSYICVPTQFRGQGIATSLIESFRSSHPEMSHLALDVFRDNIAARLMYEKLGFVCQDATAWIVKELPESNDRVTIPNLAAPIASHQLYGFSEMTVMLAENEIRVGRLGDNVIRCFSIDDFENDDLLGGLASIFPNLRQAFAMVPETVLSSIREVPTVINRSDRMVWKV